MWQPYFWASVAVLVLISSQSVLLFIFDVKKLLFLIKKKVFMVNITHRTCAYSLSGIEDNVKLQIDPIQFVKMCGWIASQTFHSTNRKTYNQWVFLAIFFLKHFDVFSQNVRGLLNSYIHIKIVLKFLPFSRVFFSG